MYKKVTVMASECNERGHPIYGISWIAARYALAMTRNTGARNDDKYWTFAMTAETPFNFNR